MNDINQKEIYSNVDESVKNIILFDKVQEAFRLSKTIKKIFRNENLADPVMLNNYRNLYYKLRWICLSLLNWEEVKELFNSHLQFGLDLIISGYNFWEKLKYFLLDFDYSERDRIKEEIREILNKSQAKLSSKKLNIDFDPTVENWIKIYVSKIGNGIIEGIQFSQFFIESIDYNNLDEKEKIRVKKFFEFYERIKKSSFTLEGIEDVVPIDSTEFDGMIINNEVVRGDLDPKQKEIYQAVIESINKYDLDNSLQINDLQKIKNDQKNLSDLQKIAIDNEISFRKKIEDLKIEANKFATNSLERRAIEEEIVKLSK